MLSVLSVFLYVSLFSIKVGKETNGKTRWFIDAQWLVWHCSRVIRTWNGKWDTETEWPLLYPKVMISEAFHLKVTKQHSDLVWVRLHCYIWKKLLGKTGKEEKGKM